MKDFMLKIGCFLTGYNYSILKNSSQISHNLVKKYFSAILIVSLLWGFIGYAFSQRYLHLSISGAFVVGLIMIVVIIQIERQIILASGHNTTAKIFRVIIALVMAVIGSVIIDQIIFKDDVDKAKINKIQTEVDKVLFSKTAELNKQINSLDTIILKKELEREELWNEVMENPMVTTLKKEKKNYQTNIILPDGTIKDTIVTKQNLTSTEITNPKSEYILNLDGQIRVQRDKKIEKQNNLINIRQSLENELSSKTGFLDELTILFEILLSKSIALFIWICLFVFFLAIELFVLVNKFSNEENDYDIIIEHQKKVRKLMLDKLYIKTDENS